jgi:hypothetical protein
MSDGSLSSDIKRDMCVCIHEHMHTHACMHVRLRLYTYQKIRQYKNEVKKKYAMKMEVITFLGTKWTLDKNVK